MNRDILLQKTPDCKLQIWLGTRSESKKNPFCFVFSLKFYLKSLIIMEFRYFTIETRT